MLSLEKQDEFVKGKKPSGKANKGVREAALDR